VNFIQQLKNRNIPRVALANLVTAWLVIQIADTIFPYIGLSRNTVTTVIGIAAIGLFPFLVFAWLFEFTPEGIKREKDIDRSIDVVRASGRKLDIAIIIVMMTGLGYFIFAKCRAKQAAILSTHAIRRQKSFCCLAPAGYSNPDWWISSLLIEKSLTTAVA